MGTLSSTMTPLLLLLPVGLLAEEVVLITGGYNGSNYLSTNEVLGFPSCQVANFPGGVFSSPHYGHSTALTSSGLLLTCGGILQPRACLVLDPANGIWEKHSNLDQSRISSTPVNLPQGLFLIGDDLYDMTTAGGEYFRMVVVDGKVLAVGGDDGRDYLTSVEEWDPEMEEWVTREDLEMRTARYSFGAAAVTKDLVCGSK